ncbi:MAG: hypothetical protein CL992_03000 [Euryarchaeota archaeon]|nr:hypothetical protein [Euryarchaeota archaeon]
MAAEVSEELETVSCVICGSDDYKTLYTSGKFDLKMNLSVCQNCGLSYLNPRWTKDRYMYFYTHEYDTYYRSEVHGNESEEHKYATVKIVARRLQRHSAVNPDAEAMLDIGSGMGWNLDYMKKNLYPEADLYAIEPSEHCRENLEGLGVSVVTDDVDDDWDLKSDQKFDVVMMRHVLEHFMDPVAVLQKVARKLSDDGIVYIAVPNAGFPGIPFAKHFIRVVHTYYFTIHSLRNTLAKAGLKVDVIAEKDPDNKHEIYLIASKTEKNQDVDIDPEQSALQESIYREFEGIENSTFKRLLYKLKKRLGN